MQNDIIKALNWRYAVKVFDSSHKVSDEDLHTIIEAGRLAPSSVGLEPWKFIVVSNPELRASMRAAAYDQPKVTDASHIIVIAHRTNGDALVHELIERAGKAQGKTAEQLSGLQGMAQGAVTGHSSNPDILNGWLAAQTYIPLGMMIETAALIGVDACPMEGFNSAKVNEILGLDALHLSATTMLALGYRGDDAYAQLPKTRRVFDDAVMVME